MASISIPDEINGRGSHGQLSPPRSPIEKDDSFSDVEEYPSSTIGYDFENDQTRLQLELMDDLQKLGVSEYLDLPQVSPTCAHVVDERLMTLIQLVVMGEQSTGKSSVLQAVTEIPFPIDDKMCTRFATEIVLKRTAPNLPTTIDIRIIPDASEPPQRKQTLEAWCPDGLNHSATLDKALMQDIFQQVSKPSFSLFSF